MERFAGKRYVFGILSKCFVGSRRALVGKVGAKVWLQHGDRKAIFARDCIPKLLEFLIMCLYPWKMAASAK